MQDNSKLNRIVIALGGNALGNTPKEQQEKVEIAARTLVELISQGNEIIISHGNGPQVGMINLAFEEASKINNKIVPVDLPECTAMSQGYIGYHLQNAIKKELNRQNMPWHVATVVTQIEVDKNDEAFKNPKKPIGSFYTKEEADKLMAENEGLVIKEDAGRGYRRVVPSPLPKDIVEKECIMNMLDNEFIVIACGGGGVPVVKNDDGKYEGVPAVIDKDFASAKLADTVNADYLFILTAVDRVSINWGKPNQKDLESISIEEAEKYCQEGHFAPGSMLPKVKAAIEFVKGGKGRKAVIASLEKASLVMEGKSGTVIHS
ncbi:carbamate kinase [Paramaledivibacter caminithermalis]|uniref:Carbamate kinase n=1 Tax=Paramaledivibacter caminithermalis (strain DSM 15212 / CIP 107654 / DViRD3) TaxID=1121301 RepID=A0A1M6K4V0_PARC5|nr:carbamate kinase [Paramaledivibacter caminithermalis]SHJ53900.1 carbamate kinase [Paramaledivibacter caminithermalis DSM 15212]